MSTKDLDDVDYAIQVEGGTTVAGEVLSRAVQEVYKRLSQDDIDHAINILWVLADAAFPICIPDSAVIVIIPESYLTREGLTTTIAHELGHLRNASWPKDDVALHSSHNNNYESEKAADDFAESLGFGRAYDDDELGARAIKALTRPATPIPEESAEFNEGYNVALLNVVRIIEKHGDVLWSRDKIRSLILRMQEDD